MNTRLTSMCLVLFTLFTFVASLPLNVVQRDVFVPPVTYPGNGTVWKIGGVHNVTWDITHPPKQITNIYGAIVLAKGGLMDYAHPLASGFPIMDSRHEITVPHTCVPGNDYQIVVFGDSGNYGPFFTITK